MVLLAYVNAMEVEAVVEMMVVIEVVMIVKMMVGREGRDGGRVLLGKEIS